MNKCYEHEMCDELFYDEEISDSEDAESSDGSELFTEEDESDEEERELVTRQKKPLPSLSPPPPPPPHSDISKKPTREELDKIKLLEVMIRERDALERSHEGDSEDICTHERRVNDNSHIICIECGEVFGRTIVPPLALDEDSVDDVVETSTTTNSVNRTTKFTSLIKKVREKVNIDKHINRLEENYKRLESN